jgi:hypothetical protein
MRKSAIFTVALLAFAATACVRTATDEATGSVDIDVESPTQSGELWEGSIRGTGMWASITGTSRAQVINGHTTLTLTVENAAPGSTFSWNVREGRCGEKGAVVGSANVYTTLTADSEGKAGATTSLNMRLDEAKDYVVELYAPTIDPATGMRAVAACGDLDD